MFKNGSKKDNTEICNICVKVNKYWAPKSQEMVTAAMKLKDACSLGEKL